MEYPTTTIMCPPPPDQCHENANGFPAQEIWLWIARNKRGASEVVSKVKPYLSGCGQPPLLHCEEEPLVQHVDCENSLLASSHSVTLDAGCTKFITILPLAAQHQFDCS